MIRKTMMAAAMAGAMMTAGVALAQSNGAPMSGPGQMGTPDTSMPPSNMGNSMDATTTPKMSKSEMAAMTKCQAMAADAMAKNRRCTKLMQKYPSGSMPPM